MPQKRFQKHIFFGIRTGRIKAWLCEQTGRLTEGRHTRARTHRPTITKQHIIAPFPFPISPPFTELIASHPGVQRVSCRHKAVHVQRTWCVVASLHNKSKHLSSAKREATASLFQQLPNQSLIIVLPVVPGFKDASLLSLSASHSSQWGELPPSNIVLHRLWIIPELGEALLWYYVKQAEKAFRVFQKNIVSLSSFYSFSNLHCFSLNSLCLARPCL